MVEMVFVSSTNIEAIGYDSDSAQLHVRFLKSGETYVYVNVPEYVHDAFMRSDSKGRFLSLEIKPTYECYKL